MLRKAGQSYTTRHLKRLVKNQVSITKSMLRRAGSATPGSNSCSVSTTVLSSNLEPPKYSDLVLNCNNKSLLMPESAVPCTLPENGALSPDFTETFLTLQSESSSLPTEILLIKNLNSWKVGNNISNNAYSKLLTILQSDLKLNIPKDARTVLAIDGQKTYIEMTGGSYYHFNLEESILFVLSKVSFTQCVNTLDLEINVDGLPISKSSGSQFWPILACIENIALNYVFPIGVFHGYSKPNDPNEFLKQFVDDYLKLKEKGISYQGRILNLNITKILCDAPAKAFLLCIKNHNAYSSCTKCTTEGTFISNRMTYPDTNANLRSDESVKAMIDEEYHRGTPIALLKLNIGLVSQVPLDYMHLVCLGVVKRLIRFWVNGNHSVRLNNASIDEINKRIEKYRKNTVLEFARKPRSIRDVDHWKATEFRQFIFYYGPLVMNGILQPNMWLHFLCLHVALRILASSQLCIKYNVFAGTLLRHFVEYFGDFYGGEYINHNVHNLIHLPQDVLKFGPLDKFSCFKFENFMHIIKKSIFPSRNPLKQFINRVYQHRKYLLIKEINDSKKEIKLIKPTGVQNINNKVVQTYAGAHFGKIILKVSEPNCFAILETGIPIKIFGIFENLEGKFVQYRKFSSFKKVYQEPCLSTLLNCGIVGKLENILEIIPIGKIMCKSILIDKVLISLV